MGFPAKYVPFGPDLAGSGSISLVFLGYGVGLRTVISIGNLSWGSPDAHGPGPMRAGPSEEERGSPVSPQYSQEIILPTLPGFQGAAVSSVSFFFFALNIFKWVAGQTKSKSSTLFTADG